MAPVQAIGGFYPSLPIRQTRSHLSCFHKTCVDPSILRPNAFTSWPAEPQSVEIFLIGKKKRIIYDRLAKGWLRRTCHDRHGQGHIVGLDAVTAAKYTIAASLPIIGITDNVTEPLSIRTDRESERLAERNAFHTTMANLFARHLVSVTFIVFLLLLQTLTTIVAPMILGFVSLSLLSGPRQGRNRDGQHECAGGQSTR